MGRRGKKARFAARMRVRRAAERWLRIVAHLIAVDLGCADRPWFRLALPENCRRRNARRG